MNIQLAVERLRVQGHISCSLCIPHVYKLARELLVHIQGYIKFGLVGPDFRSTPTKIIHVREDATRGHSDFLRTCGRARQEEELGDDLTKRTIPSPARRPLARTTPGPCSGLVIERLSGCPPYAACIANPVNSDLR